MKMKRECAVEDGERAVTPLLLRRIRHALSLSPRCSCGALATHIRGVAATDPPPECARCARVSQYAKRYRK